MARKCKTQKQIIRGMFGRNIPLDQMDKEEKRIVKKVHTEWNKGCRR